MLQRAGAEHIPVNPSATKAFTSTSLPPLPPSPSKVVPTPHTRLSISSLLSELSESDSYKEQIVHRRTLDSREAVFADLGRELDGEILRALELSKGIPEGGFRFYTHQAEAINAVMGWDDRKSDESSDPFGGVKADVFGETKTEEDSKELRKNENSEKTNLQSRHVVVSTPTASGKSVIYQVPTLCALMDESDPDACAMFIYPTKARYLSSLS